MLLKNTLFTMYKIVGWKNEITCVVETPLQGKVKKSNIFKIVDHEYESYTKFLRH